MAIHDRVLSTPRSSSASVAPELRLREAKHKSNTDLSTYSIGALRKQALDVLEPSYTGALEPPVITKIKSLYPLSFFSLIRELTTPHEEKTAYASPMDEASLTEVILRSLLVRHEKYRKMRALLSHTNSSEIEERLTENQVYLNGCVTSLLNILSLPIPETHQLIRRMAVLECVVADDSNSDIADPACLTLINYKHSIFDVYIDIILNRKFSDQQLLLSEIDFVINVMQSLLYNSTHPIKNLLVRICHDQFIDVSRIERPPVKAFLYFTLLSHEAGIFLRNIHSNKSKSKLIELLNQFNTLQLQTIKYFHSEIDTVFIKTMKMSWTLFSTLNTFHKKAIEIGLSQREIDITGQEICAMLEKIFSNQSINTEKLKQLLTIIKKRLMNQKNINENYRGIPGNPHWKKETVGASCIVSIFFAVLTAAGLIKLTAGHDEAPKGAALTGVGTLLLLAMAIWSYRAARPHGLAHRMFIFDEKARRLPSPDMKESQLSVHVEVNAGPSGGLKQ